VRWVCRVSRQLWPVRFTMPPASACVHYRSRFLGWFRF